ncbi:MAG: HNH endonuclease [Anaerolineales bacterium]|nr:HNH endonuclease [Anaerolineales bacterium]
MNDPVLLLNANFEPLNVCSTRRAVGLIQTGKAEMLLNGRGFIQTVRTQFPRPSVIRLVYMIKRPRVRVPLSKREIFRRDHYRCQYCGVRNTILTIDHIIPRRLGGDYSWTNLVTACQECNLKKGGRTLQECGLSLLQPPHEPRPTADYIFGHHLIEGQNDDWEQFLHGW